MTIKQKSYRGASVRLSEDATKSDETTYVWVQLAREGEYLGYQGGSRPFSFTRPVFDELVRNLWRHPSYDIGADGVGTADVVPWDFNHASERDPVAGALSVQGAPAQGWTSDLEVRTGEDGKAELWGFTRFLSPLREYIRSGQYRWASVAVSFDALDPVTGENIGAVLTSIAATNQPFIEGMSPLVAASRVPIAQSAGTTADEQTIDDTIARLRRERPGFVRLSRDQQYEQGMIERARMRAENGVVRARVVAIARVR